MAHVESRGGKDDGGEMISGEFAEARAVEPPSSDRLDGRACEEAATECPLLLKGGTENQPKSQFFNSLSLEEAVKVGCILSDVLNLANVLLSPSRLFHHQQAAMHRIMMREIPVTIRNRSSINFYDGKLLRSEGIDDPDYSCTNGWLLARG